MSQSASPTHVWTGYQAATPATLRTRLARRQGHAKLLIFLAVGLGVLTVVLIIVAVSITPAPGPTCQGPSCAPPVGTPVKASLSYTSTAYHYSVDYFVSDGISVTAQRSATSLVLSYTNLKDGPASITFTAGKEGGSSPQAVVQDIQSRYFAGATMAFAIWNPMVGYQLGYGAVYDYTPQSGNGTAVRQRVVIVAAVKRGLTVVAIAEGRYHQFTTDFSLGHPSALDTLIGFFLDDPLNSVRWPGDPPR